MVERLMDDSMNIRSRIVPSWQLLRHALKPTLYAALDVSPQSLHSGSPQLMDSISLLVGPPPSASRALNQDDFDARYSFAKYRKKKTNTEILRQFLIGENWLLYQSPNSWTQILPITTWINKYHVKDSLGKDILGAVYLAFLLLPQAIGYGVLINDVRSAIFSLFIPQIVYAFFGSAQHSSLGALSFTSIMVYCSLEYSHSHLSSISLCCAVIQLAQFLLPLEFIFSYISTSALSGFSVGLFVRIVFRFLPQFLVFRGHDCKSTTAVGMLLPNTTNDVKRVLQCFYAAVPCLRSADNLLIIATVVAALIFILFKWRLSRLLASKIGFSMPHEFLVLLVVTLIIFFFQPNQTSESIAQKLDVSLPRVALWQFPTWVTWLDSFAISIYAMTSHMQITKSIAEEKMYKVHRKQELFCFSLISLISSMFGLLPPSSSYGSSQINVESSKFSLVANVLMLIPLFLMIHFGAPLFNALPFCAIGVMIMTSFNGWFSDIKLIRKTFYSSSWDASIAVSAIACAIVFPNVCTGFIAMLLMQVFAVSLKVQWPHMEVMAKLSDSHYAEENRYEGDCLDTPVRIIRLSGPLLSVNCENVRNELYKQAVVVKGLIGIGIGTRTGSLRSQCPSAIGPKESVTARESVNLSANITIIQENDVSIAPPSTDSPPIVRFLVLSMNGVTGIDKDMLTCLSQVYGDLNSENIRILLAGVPAFVRDSMELLGFYNTVPRTQFYPNVQEALLCARNTVLPFHMSVSMNGYRDVIALSCAASNADLNRQPSPEAV
uniref:STAS domain-containing protein n=2 Tax=Caenorhabditis japonica TaxID=281687 RepID=A0A8R1E025_CAEJA